jgi:hypothetical protein
LNAGDFLPVQTTVGGLVDGEVDWRGLRRVVLPGGDESAILELSTAGVQNTRVGVVRGRCEDHIAGEGRLRLLGLVLAGSSRDDRQKGEDEGREKHLGRLDLNAR